MFDFSYLADIAWLHPTSTFSCPSSVFNKAQMSGELIRIQGGYFLHIINPCLYLQPRDRERTLAQSCVRKRKQRVDIEKGITSQEAAHNRIRFSQSDRELGHP